MNALKINLVKMLKETRLAIFVGWRYFKTGTRSIDLMSFLALAGIVLGVASLVVSMSVVSGYETTLRTVITDAFGHLTVLKKNSRESEMLNTEEISRLIDGLMASTPFAVAEGLLPHNKKVLGVYLEGIDPKTVRGVSNINQRLIQGNFDLSFQQQIPSAIVGRVLAKNFNLELGDTFSVVIPFSKAGGTVLRPKLQRFRLTGVASFGKHDYDERLIFANRKVVKDFAGKSSLEGHRFRIQNPKLADTIADRINNEFPGNVNARSWRAMNRHLFEAIQFEKPTIFLVILIIVIAASFNVASTLYINILNKYSDIATLKALGVKRKLIAKIFVLQGLFIGFLGCSLGLAIGVGLSWFFVSFQNWFSLIPEEIYKLTFIQAELRALDLIVIFFVSMLICFFSTLAPALRGANLKPTEGLRYE